MGQLIAPHYVEIFQLDTAATAANDVDGAGPIASGYDPVFRSVEMADTNEDGKFTSARTESGPILVPCQIEYASFEAQTMVATGDSPISLIKLIFDYCELKGLGFIDAKGKPVIRKNDRVARILDCDAVTVLQEWEDDRVSSEGMYVNEVVTTFGFDGGELVICTLEQKQQGAFL